MILIDFAKKAEKLVLDNSPAILTAIGVTGVATTAYLTHKAAIETAEIFRIEAAERDWYINKDTPARFEKLELVWKLYVPPVASGALTIACIVAANRVGTRRAAALAAAYSLSEKAFVEYKEKVVEKIGVNKERAVRDEIAQDRVNKNPSREVSIIGNGDVLCYDSLTGRYFNSSVEMIKKAMNDINFHIINDMYASLSDFYEKIGLPQTPYSEEVGWNIDTQLDVTFSTTLTEDQRPCVVIDYTYSPIRGYNRLV